MQRGQAPVIVLVGVVVLVAVAAGAYYFGKLPIKPADNNRKACTQEAKQCPDGSYVGRVGPNCEFSPCPTATPKISDETASWKTYTGKYFTFKYPASWNLDLSNDTSVSLSITESTTKKAGGDYTPGMGLLNFDISSDSAQKIIDSTSGIEKSNKVNINGIVGMRLTGHSGVGGSVYFANIIMENNGKTYLIDLSTQDSDLEAQFTAELDQILSTFKFTN